MFAYLKGTISHLTPSLVDLEVGSIGYEIHIGPNTFSSLSSVSGVITLFICQIIRENAHTLYGFTQREEKQAFEQLINVSGVGPKTALCLVDHLGMAQLEQALLKEDIAAICQVPGIGKKTALRLIMEMKDKFALRPCEKAHSTSSLHMQDAIHALLNLGYKQQVAQKAIQKTLQDETEELDLPSLITKSLKHV